MIVQEGGRYRSVRAPEDDLDLFVEDWSHLTEIERAAFAEILSDAELHRDVLADQYEESPLSPAEWLASEYHGLALARDFWPRHQDDFVEFQSGSYVEYYLTGSLGVGKTYAASVNLAYDLYRLVCLKDPALSYGQASGTQLVLFAFSTTIGQASLGIGYDFKGNLQKIPFFRDRMDFRGSGSLVRCPKHVLFTVGTEGANRVLGLAACGGVFDESDFQGEVRGRGIGTTMAGSDVRDRAQKLYVGALRRIRSRFQKRGSIPAHLYLLSSKSTRASFMANQLRIKRNDPRTFVRDYAIYEIRPRDHFLSQEFEVFIGTDTIEPRVLRPGDVDGLPPEYRALVIHVPMDFWTDFEQDVVGALADVAGIAVRGGDKFIRLPSRIDDMEDPSRVHPFSPVEWVCGGEGGFRWDLLAERSERRLPGGLHETRWIPKVDPGAVRFAHVDTSQSDMATGLAVGHVARIVEVVRRDSDLREVTEKVPVVYVDFVLRILPPPGGEIDLGKVRGLLYELRAHGFNVAYCTMDSFQSAEARLRLEENGIEAEVVSTDRDRKVYDTFKTALYEGRVVGYCYPILHRELENLEEDPVSGKIVRPKRFMDGGKSSKDIADALACMVYGLTVRQIGGEACAPPLERARKAEESETWVTGGAMPVSMWENGG